MKDKKWRVGDRVEYRKADGAPGSSMLNGCRGTVVYIDGQEASCTVRFDKIVPLGVTEMRGGLYEKNCWYCRPDSLIGVPGRPPVQEKEQAGKGRKKTEAHVTGRAAIRHDEKMPCADGNMREKTEGADGVQDSNVQDSNVHDYHEHARCEPEVDNRNSNGRRELPVWLL